MVLGILFKMFLSSISIEHIASQSDEMTFAMRLLRREIALIGRHDLLTKKGYPRSDWPGSGIKFKVRSHNETFEALQVQVSFGECFVPCKYFVQVDVNGESKDIFEVSEVSGTVHSFSLFPSHLKFEFDVTILKRTEAWNEDAKGVMQIDDVVIGGGSFEVLEKVKERERAPRILFIGDSVAAGYGVDGFPPCWFSASTENALDAFAARAAKSLKADYHLIAWSSKGAVRNFGDPNNRSPDPVPFYYNRTIASNSAAELYWHPQMWQPDVVFVMLGTNDFACGPPDDTIFIEGLSSFLNLIHRDYPHADIVAACSPMQAGRQCEDIAKAAQSLEVAQYLHIGPEALYGGYGCGEHPSMDAHRNIVEAIVPTLKSILYSRRKQR